MNTFFVNAGFVVQPAAAIAAGGSKASSLSKRWTWRKEKVQTRTEARIALRTMEGDAEFESCTKGDQIDVIEELDDGSGFMILTSEGKRLLHPDAFTEP